MTFESMTAPGISYRCTMAQAWCRHRAFPRLRGDDDFGPRLTGADVAHGLASLGKRIGAIDHRAQLAGLDEVPEVHQVLGVALRDVELHALAQHPSTHHHIDDPREDADPTAALRRANLHEHAVRRQDASQ